MPFTKVENKNIKRRDGFLIHCPQPSMRLGKALLGGQTERGQESPPESLTLNGFADGVK